jgi:hypothetical protein
LILGEIFPLIETLMDLLKSVTTRKKIFDVALVATLKDHGVPGLYTVNTKDKGSNSGWIKKSFKNSK